MFTNSVPFTGLQGISDQPDHIFRFEEAAAISIDQAFAASRGRAIRPVSSLHRLPNGQRVLLSLPQLMLHGSSAGFETEMQEADFVNGFSCLTDTALLCDLELEIYLRTGEDRIIDLLDFSEISEEADEDGYVVGYVALTHLIRHRDTLRKYGVFLLRTGPLRAVSLETQEVLAASAA